MVHYRYLVPISKVPLRGHHQTLSHNTWEFGGSESGKYFMPFIPRARESTGSAGIILHHDNRKDSCGREDERHGNRSEFIR